MIEPDFPSLQRQTPERVRVESIAQMLTERLEPVKAVPSETLLIATCLGLWSILVLAIAWLCGFNGWHALRPQQRAWEYGLNLLAGGLLAMVVVRQAIPGSRTTVDVARSVILTCVGLIVTILLLFPDRSAQEFVHRGWPCLRLGAICALPAILIWQRIMRLGYVTDPSKAMLAAAALAGWLGIGVLALHCPIRNASHILVWHGGALAVALLAGVAAERWMAQNKRDQL